MQIATDGVSADGVVVHLTASYVRDDGTLALGTLTTQDTRVIASSLPAEAGDAIADYQRDAALLPQVEDANACATAQNTYFWAVLGAEVACSSAPTAAGFGACLVALGYATNCYNNQVAACDQCACPSGEQCDEGTCVPIPCYADWQCQSEYGADYVCSGGGCVASTLNVCYDEGNCWDTCGNMEPDGTACENGEPGEPMCEGGACTSDGGGWAGDN
jgi:hypothetical protein